MSIAYRDPLEGTGVVRQPSLVDQVAEGLRTEIRAGIYAPGATLPSVQALSERWRVSRTVLREALSRLSAEGFVNSRQGLGVFVAQELPQKRLVLAGGRSAAVDLARIIELRAGIETEAAALAALRRTDGDLERMREGLRLMALHVGDADIDRSIEADLDFHRAICAATGNEYFASLFDFLGQFLFVNISISRRNSAGSMGRGMEAQAEHETIFRAVEGRNARAARAAARKHVANTGRRLGLPELVGDESPEA